MNFNDAKHILTHPDDHCWTDVVAAASVVLAACERMEKELATSARLAHVVQDYLADRLGAVMFRCVAGVILDDLLPQK